MSLYKINIVLSAAAAAVLSYLLHITWRQFWVPFVLFACAWIVFFVLTWTVIAAVSLTVNVKKEYDKPSRFYRAFFNICYAYVCELARVRIHTEGMEKLSGDIGTFMFVSNHRSKFDNMIQSVVLGKYPLAFVSKPENFKIPMGHRFMTRGCYLKIDRENPREALKTVNRASELLKSGAVSIGVFPEGHRTGGPMTDVFKSGCFLMVLRAKCPIVVAVTRGTEDIHKNFPLRHTDVYLNIIEVLPYETLEGKSSACISELVKGKIDNYIIENNEGEDKDDTCTVQSAVK